MSFWNTAKGYVAYEFFAGEEFMIGEHTAKILVKTLPEIEISPSRYMKITMNILPCFVEKFN